MIFEFSMYYLSFLPLWISIIVIDVISLGRGTENKWTEIISIPIIMLGIVLCSIVSYKWLTKKGNVNREKYRIEKAKEERFVTAEFLMSYVFPLYAFDFTQWDGVILFGLFFLIFYFLVHRHQYFCTNLALEICKYRIYQCDLKIEKVIISKRVVSRNELDGLVGKIVRTRKFNNDYHFEVGVEQDDEES